MPVGSSDHRANRRRRKPTPRRGRWTSGESSARTEPTEYQYPTVAPCAPDSSFGSNRANTDTTDSCVVYIGQLFRLELNRPNTDTRRLHRVRRATLSARTARRPTQLIAASRTLVGAFGLKRTARRLHGRRLCPYTPDGSCNLNHAARGCTVVRKWLSIWVRRTASRFQITTFYQPVQDFRRKLAIFGNLLKSIRRIFVNSTKTPCTPPYERLSVVPL